MTNVNPGNRDPRKGRFGASRKFFSRDKSDDLLQDRDDLADNLADDLAQDDRAQRVQDGRVHEGRAQDGRVQDGRVQDGRVQEHYETAGDGSFDEALDQYYDGRVDRDGVQRESAPRGKHHRREDDDVVSADNDNDDYSDYANTDYTTAATTGAGYTDGNYAEVAEVAESDYGDYVDAEYEPVHESGQPEYRGHGDYEDYDDDRTVAVAAAPAGANVAATGAATTGAAGAGSSTAAATGGVPKRGLAMILIAVALLLALWGVYAMTRDNSDDQAAKEPANQSTQDTNNANGQGQNGQNGQNNQNGQNPNDPNAAGQNGQNPNDPNAQGQQGASQGQDGQSGQAGGAAPAGANNPMTSENQTINVYNNSAISGFADQVAGQVEANGTKVGEVGNIPGEVVTFEQNTVLFDPATPDAERFARELADKVGGVAVPADDRIPAEARKPGSLTLVLAENRPVNI